MKWEYAADIGSENIRFISMARQVSYRLPSLLALRGSRTPFACGRAAQEMLGRASDVRLVRCMSGGVPKDCALAGWWISRLIRESEGPFALKRGGALISVAPRFNGQELLTSLNAISREAGLTIGAVSADAAAALGAGLSDEGAHALLNLGADSITASVIAGYRTISFKSLPYGLRRADETVIERLAGQGVRIGPLTARELRHASGGLGSLESKETKQVNGLNLLRGLPESFEVPFNIIYAAVSEVIQDAARLARSALSLLPPEAAADVAKEGITITGGGGEMFGCDRLISELVKLPVRTAEQPEECEIAGLNKILASPELERLVIMQSSRNED